MNVIIAEAIAEVIITIHKHCEYNYLAIIEAKSLLLMLALSSTIKDY